MLRRKLALALAISWAQEVSSSIATFWNDASCGAANGTLMASLNFEEVPCVPFNTSFHSVQLYNNSCRIGFYQDPVCSRWIQAIAMGANLQCYDFLGGSFLSVGCAQTCKDRSKQKGIGEHSKM
jgi:hypothetical protein